MHLHNPALPWLRRTVRNGGHPGSKAPCPQNCDFRLLCCEYPTRLQVLKEKAGDRLKKHYNSLQVDNDAVQKGHRHPPHATVEGGSESKEREREREGDTHINEYIYVYTGGQGSASRKRQEELGRGTGAEGEGVGRGRARERSPMSHPVWDHVPTTTLLSLAQGWRALGPGTPPLIVIII